MNQPFVIFSLPRSRSFWLSRFLTYNDWVCGHEEIRHCRSLDDVRSWLAQPCTGTCETAAAPYWRLLRHYRPDARIVTIRRPVEEVTASVVRHFRSDPAYAMAVLRRFDAKLDQIEARTDALRFEYSDLANEATCARLFEHCLGYKHDVAWWLSMSQLNLQVNLSHVYRYMEAHWPQLEKVAKQAKHRIISLMPRHTEIDGVTFQCEPWRQFYQDAKPLFAEHLTQIDQSPEAYATKNIPLFERLDDMGGLHVFTSRCNGRMFSYLVSVVGPSLESPHEMAAEQTIFFADPSFPGIGMKTQRAAIEDLRARGVHRVLMRAGHRGSGPRLGAMFRRLGAEPFGNLYNLPLAADDNAA